MVSISNCISFQSSNAAKHISRLSRDRLAPFGITPIQFAILQAVSENEGRTSAEIGSLLSIDSATIVGVIDRLAATDMLSRASDKKDRRVKRLHLTNRAREELPKLNQAMTDLNEEIDQALEGAAADVRGSLEKLAKLELEQKEKRQE